MAYRKYRCIVSHVTDRLFKKGLIYLFVSDPGAKFELTTDDPRLPAENTGTVDLDGTWYPGFVGYDDLSFSLTQSKQGANDLPPYDYDDMGIAFPQDNAAQIVYLNQLTKHSMRNGPDVIWHPHLHYIQDEATIPVFEYRYRFTPAGHVVPALSAWIPTTGDQVFPYTTGKIQQIMEFPSLLVGDIGLAAAVDVQVRRNDNVVTGAVVVKTFDFHAPSDAPLGSGQEFLK